MKTVPAAWAKARGSSRSYKIKSKSSRLPPLLQGVEALAVAFDLAIRGPSVAAEAADKTRRAPHRDVRRFSRGQDAPRKNPPAPRTRCNAPSMKAGYDSLSTLSLHTQRKVTRAVQVRKRLVFALRVSRKKKSTSREWTRVGEVKNV